MKTKLKKPIDPLGEVPTKNKTEYSCWQPVSRLYLLSVRPDGQPIILNREWTLSGGRPDRSIGTNREHCSFCRSTGTVDRCAHMHIGTCR